MPLPVVPLARYQNEKVLRALRRGDELAKPIQIADGLLLDAFGTNYHIRNLKPSYLLKCEYACSLFYDLHHIPGYFSREYFDLLHLVPAVRWAVKSTVPGACRNIRQIQEEYVMDIVFFEKTLMHFRLSQLPHPSSKTRRDRSLSTEAWKKLPNSG